MRIDIHNHTTLCNHAEGTMEQYIQKAIELNIDVYGFSEHAPMKNFEDGYRLVIEKKDFYENEVKKLQKKYKEQIKLTLGYEVDYLQGDYILETIKESKVDYMIGSVHYLGDWGFDNPEFIGVYKSKNIDTIWEEYFEAVKQMANTNLFQVVGHLDLIKLFKYLPKKDIKSLALDAIKAIKKANMVIEINSAGFRKPIKEQYPSTKLLELAFEYDIPITTSSDAHHVDQIGFMYDEVIQIAQKIGYTQAVYFEQKEPIKVSLF